MAMDKNTINAVLLNRSYKLILKHARKPTKNEKTFHGRTIIDIDKTVITNEAYDPMKSANCRPS